MAQPLFQIHRNAIAKGTLHRKKSTKTQVTFSDKATQILTPTDTPPKNPVDDNVGTTEMTINIDELCHLSQERTEINSKFYTLREMIDLVSIFGKPELNKMGANFWFDVEKTILVKHGQHWYGQSAMGDTPFKAVADFFQRVTSGDEVKAGTGPIYTWNNNQNAFELVRTRVSKAHDILDTF